MKEVNTMAQGLARLYSRQEKTLQEKFKHDSTGLELFKYLYTMIDSIYRFDRLKLKNVRYEMIQCIKELLLDKGYSLKA